MPETKSSRCAAIEGVRDPHCRDSHRCRIGWLCRVHADKPVNKGRRGALIGGAFALRDGAGKTVSDQTLRGKPFLVYFGYTHCPDVCPTELAHISDILEQDGE